MYVKAVVATSAAWLLALSLLGPRVGHAAVIWKADFETGDLKQFMGGVNQTKGTRVNAEVVKTPVQQGMSAGKLTIHADDTFGGGQMRVQLDRRSPRTGEGMDMYMSFWFMMTTAPGVRDNFNYFESFGSNQNMMTWWVAPKAGGGTTVNYGTGSLGRTVQWTADFTLNEWHQMAMQIHWSANAANGAVKLWYDGKPVLDIKAKTKADGNAMNMQTGFHRAGQSSAVDTIYLDNYIEGDTLEDIQITTTGPSDGGLPAGDGGNGMDAGPQGSGGSSGGSGGATGSGGSPLPPMTGSGGQAGPDASSVGGVNAGGCAVGGDVSASSFTGLALGFLVALRLRRARRS